jgi:hypothetical protein
MTHIKIDSSGVGEKSSIARGLIMPTVMQVQHASPLNLE